MVEGEVWIKVSDAKAPSKKIIVQDNSGKRAQLRRDLDLVKVEFGKSSQNLVGFIISFSKFIFRLFRVLGHVLILWGSRVREKDKDFDKKNGGGVM